MNIQAKQKAKELIEWFMVTDSLPVSTYNLMFEKQRLNRAKQCAIKVCDEVLSDMGSDRGYEFWTDVKQAIQDYE